MAVNPYGWSTTAGSNTSVGGVSIAEGMAPSGVNNAIRAAMAGVKELLDAIGGAKTTTGSSNAYVLTTGLSISALAAGHILGFKANHTNTGAATIAIDGLTAVDIKRVDASALLSGDITSGGIYLIAYEATAGDVWLLNPTPNAALSTYPDPTSNDADSLGVSGTAWSDLFLASGGVINWNAGDVTITHSANTLAFGGASSGYTFDAAPLPSANDGAALGASGTAWADLFLASGGVINFNAGNVTITHSAGLLTASGAFSVGTTNALTAGSVELGHASDTTLAREAAGQVTIEGNRVYSAKAAQWDALTEKSSIADADLILIEDSAASGAKKKVQKSNLVGAGLSAATQAEMETASSTSVASTPGRQHFHPGHPKCWAHVNGGASPALATSYNITSITDSGSGLLTVTIATDFSSVDWACLATGEWSQTISISGTGIMSFVQIDSGTLAAGSVRLEGLTYNDGDDDLTNEDPTSWHMVGLGDHA